MSLQILEDLSKGFGVKLPPKFDTPLNPTNHDTFKNKNAYKLLTYKPCE